MLSMKIKSNIFIQFAVFILVGCTRIESGEVGLRVGFDRQVDLTELLPGSFNQTLVGDVVTFPVRDITINLENISAQTSDNSTLKDFDMMIIYSINPASVGELYTTKSRGFHEFQHGDWYLMYNYVINIARSAAYKSVRKHEALKVADSRPKIEADTLEFIREAFKDEKLDASITVSQAQIRNIQPADAIIASANDVLRAQNELKTKQIEVQTAQAEAQRLAALANNLSSIRYMEAKALSDIAEGIKNGKVQTIVVPFDFKGIINAGAK
jgi:regulator of protease activity HflC (stomatin/prohibitin superfamily)